MEEGGAGEIGQGRGGFWVVAETLNPQNPRLLSVGWCWVRQSGMACHIGEEDISSRFHKKQLVGRMCTWDSGESANVAPR